jgi:hypothetical protein
MIVQDWGENASRFLTEKHVLPKKSEQRKTPTLSHRGFEGRYSELACLIGKSATNDY